MNSNSTYVLTRLIRLLAAVAVLALLFSRQPAQAQAIGDATKAQIQVLMAEKAGRTPAQRKMDSQLVLGVKQQRGELAVPGLERFQTKLAADAADRVLVDIDATVSNELLDFIHGTGGGVVNSFPAFHAIRALVPSGALEALAARVEVRFVKPAAEATTDTGSVTSQGDRTHRANVARATFGADGTGVTVGVLSNGIDSLSTSIASGNLNSSSTFIPGQAGSGDEGTAMMEIVQDIVPGAQIIFATAVNGSASFASNILALQAAGCTVIVDDVGYSDESPFQDMVIARAVQTVSDLGVMYFVSARNAGNKNDGTSGTWEGDFADGGALTIGGKTGRVHNFGGGVLFNTVNSGGSQYRVDLFWADPLGGSGNDYDLFVTDASGNVLRSSTNVQSGTQDPYEGVSTLNVGERVVILQEPGAASRFLHLDTGRGRLAINTAGRTRGHHASAAANQFGVAATNVANSPSPGAFVGGTQNPVESFSSDGPRRMFFQTNGTPYTPGNFSSTGGLVLDKPDLTAADGVVTTLPGSTGLNPFFGTSAAAPHAAAIAALIRSYNPTLTPTQVRTLMTSTALDIEAAGPDRDSGAGIVDAFAALQAAPAFDPLTISFTGLAATGPASGPFAPGSGTFTLTNNSAVSIHWTATKTQTWLTLGPASGDLAPGGATNVNVALDAVAVATFGVGAYADAIAIVNTTSGLSRNYPVSLSVTPLQSPALFDSFTNGALSFTSSTPHTFMGIPLILGTAGGTSNITVAGGTLYLAAAATASYTNVRVNVTFWGTATGANTGTTQAFANPLGTFSFDLGPLDAVGGGTYPYPFTLPSPITIPAPTCGVAINWQGDTGSGLTSTENLTTALRSGSAVATGSLFVGTAGTYGYYRNVSGETDFNFNGGSFRSLTSGVANQCLALQLFGPPVAPLAITNTANVAGTSATLNASVNPGGISTTAAFDFGTSTNYGGNVTAKLSPTNGTTVQSVSALVKGLLPNTPYHFRATASNGYGTGNGINLTFTTGAAIAPVPTTSAGSLGYVENQAAATIDPDLTLADTDSLNLTRATVAITTNFALGQDLLSFSNQNGISGAYNSTTGVLTLTGTASLADYETALRSVAYRNTSSNPSSLTRMVTFTADDGFATGTATRTIAVTPINNAPSLIAINNPPSILEGAGTQTINFTGVSAGGEAQTLTVTATSNNPALIPDPNVAYTSPNLFGSLSYAPVANASGTATITVKVQDSGGTANGGIDTFTRTFTVQVIAVNDAPSFAMGASIAVLEDSGAHTLSWATSISPGADDETGQTLTFLVDNDNPALFSSPPAIDPGGALSFTSAANAAGSATVTVRLQDNGGVANNGADTSAPQTFTINVNGVNDTPSFVKGADQTVAQGVGLKTVANWATAISAGGADEAGQTLNFIVGTDNDALFTVPPAVSSTGTLTFTPNSLASGSANVTVTLHDDAGTINSGVDTSGPQTFVVTTLAVNDAPSFTIGLDQTVGREDGPQTVTDFATDILPGPSDEASQAVDFRVETDHREMFATPPSISSDGTLHYTPAPTASGEARVTVRLHDDGPSAPPDVALSEPQTFRIFITTYVEELGTYNGLALPSPGATPGADKTGLLKVTLTKKGKLSGKLRLGAFGYSFTGTIDDAGDVTFGKTAAPTMILKRKPPLTDLTLAGLHIDVSGGTDALTGTVEDGGAPFAALNGDRALYTSKKNPVAPLRPVPPGLAGKYTVFFTEPLAPGLPANGVPHGDGYGFLTVGPGGVAKLAGSLADGTKLACANALSKDNFWPLFVSFSKGQGALAGPAHFETLSSPVPSDLNAPGLLWFRPRSDKAKFFLPGWPLGITTDLFGSIYLVPPKTAPDCVLPGLDFIQPDLDGNAKLTLTGGNFSLPFNKTLNISTENEVSVLTPTGDKFNMSIMKDTGLFKGSLTHPATGKPAAFQGVILQKQQSGAGFFLGPTQSGSAVLVPIPHGP